VDGRDRRCVVNGKFLGRRATGTERYASELVTAVDALLPASADWTLLCPPGTRAPPLARIRVRHVGPAGLPAHAWEQLALPAAAGGARLLNLAGTSPWAGARRSASVLHDAAVFDHPEAYTRPFVAWYRRSFRHLAASGARLMTVSAFSRERLCAALGTPASRWAVVPDGGDHFERIAADAGAVRRLGLSGRRLLLAVASANPTKNLERLLDAYRRLAPGDDVRLVLVGGGNAAVFSADAGGAAAGRPAGGAHDPPGVVRTGPVDDATLKALYLQARALVFPSLYEGFGLPPLEAMSLGCPVVAARAASLPEVCGDAALYVDPLSVDSIAAGMRRILDDDALVARLTVAGRARAATMTWRASAERLLEALGP
jgi:glycosyltransferase involved in cell wall biosynthesis